MACVCVTNQQHTQASRPAHRRRRQAYPCATVGLRRHTALARCGRTSACSDRRTRPRDSTGATVNSGSTATANPTALRCAIAEIACRYLLAERPGAAIGRHLCACCKPGGDALVRPGLPHRSPGAPGTYRGCWPPSGDARARGETSRPGAVGAAWAFVAKDSCEYPTLLFQFPGHF